MTCAVGRAAAASVGQSRFREGQAHQVHSVVKQGKHHGQQGRLLTAVEGLSRGKDAGGLARQGAGQSTSAPVPSKKMFDGRRHISKSSRAAENQAAALHEIIMRGVGRPLVRHLRIKPLRGRRDRRNGAQSRLHARDGLHAAADLPRQGGGAALARIIQNQYFIHRWSSVEILQDCACAAPAQRIKQANTAIV